VPLSTQRGSLIALDFNRDAYALSADIYGTRSSSPAFVLEMHGETAHLGITEDASTLGKLAGVKGKRMAGAVNATLHLNNFVTSILPALLEVDACWLSGRVVDEYEGEIAHGIDVCIHGGPVVGWTLDPARGYIGDHTFAELTGRLSLAFFNSSLIFFPVSLSGNLTTTALGCTLSAHTNIASNFTLELS
jgi:hypothetical protein